MSWYSQSQLKKPYKVYIKWPSGDLKLLGSFNITQSDEKTEEQAAKARAYKKYFNFISDARQVGGILLATLDVKKWEEMLERQKLEKEKEEENIQEAWWNK